MTRREIFAAPLALLGFAEPAKKIPTIYFGDITIKVADVSSADVANAIRREMLAAVKGL